MANVTLSPAMTQEDMNAFLASLGVNTNPFKHHHLAKIVTAAVYSDALHIEEGVVGLKQRAHELALAGASAAWAPRAAAPRYRPRRLAPRRHRVCVTGVSAVV